MFFRGTPMLRHTQTGFTRLSFLGLALCFLLFGCGDTCFVITGIFPNTTSITNPPTCKLGDGTGTIIVGINSSHPSPGAPTSPNLEHLFITLRGIDANADAIATEDSPNWHELAPGLASEPVQIDLMNTSVSGASCAPSLTRKATVRAEEYRQIRLRLVSDQPTAGDPLPNHNECGGRSFNCVVDTNGYTHALALKNGELDLLITSDHIADGSFNVLPDTETRLSIVFNPYSSLATAVSDGVQVVPVFSAETASGCTPASSSP
jgi:hypothetical protein